MTLRIGLLIACAGTLALTTPASAHATIDHILQSAERGKMMNVAAATSKQRRGVSAPTGDVDGDGDGASDVVVASPPKPKHKPATRPRRR